MTLFSKAFPQSKFSLSEEARNTENRHGWNSDLKLRHSRITFVSAGTSSAEELTQAPQEKSIDTSETTPQGKRDVTRDSTAHLSQKKADGRIDLAKKPVAHVTSAEKLMYDMTLNETDPTESSVPDAGIAFKQYCQGLSYGGRRHRTDSQLASNGIFFTDVNGSDTPVRTGLPPPVIERSPSPAESDSSEEIIVFAGRQGSRNPGSKAQTSKAILEKGARQEISELRVAAKKTGRVVNDDPMTSTPKQKTSANEQPSSSKVTDLAGSLKKANGEVKMDTKRRRGGKRGKASAKDIREAEILADYIANTQDSDDLNSFAEGSRLNNRDLGGPETAEWQDDDESSAFEEEVNIAINATEDWDSADLQDFDDLSTSNEAPNVVAQILYKRERPSGIQYLVVGEGFTVDDARWLPLSALSMSGASEMIRKFEEEQTVFEQLLDDSDDSDANLTKDEQLARDLQEQIDDMEDERDLEERRLARMTDEQIARLLAKQEELGLGSDSLMLFTGTDIDEDEGVPQLDGATTGARQITPKARRKPGSRGTQASFPSATAFAAVLDQDPYNGFDVMDHERPSLRKIPKGRRGKLPIELSDSEFEQSMNMAWENDRSKKKARKQEREEQRAQGLLGKKGKLDMKAKYSEGMTLEQVKKEIKDFLCSSLERYWSCLSRMFSYH